MMEERSKQWTRAAVEASVARNFLHEEPATVLAILDEYEISDSDVARWGSVVAERGRARVQLAILALSGGDVDRLLYYADLARQDFRDVLYWAEQLPEEDDPEQAIGVSSD